MPALPPLRCCIHDEPARNWFGYRDIAAHDADVYALYHESVFHERHPFVLCTIDIDGVRFRVSKLAWCWAHLLGSSGRPRRGVAPTHLRYTLPDGSPLTQDRLDDERAMLALG